MDMETVEHGRSAGPRRIAHRRDLTYQFPVYRWLSWLVVLGFAVGLGMMFLVAGMFGIPAPLGWAFLVVLFLAGVALLERPKTLLTVMMFYTLLMPSNRLLGLVGLPLPGFLDELFFLPFLAVIIMSWIQRSETPTGAWFGLAFVGLSVLSWCVNGRPAPFRAAQVTMIMMKFYILWYYCRLTCTFKDMDHFWKWGRIYIYYAALQFLYNCLWQGFRPWVTRHWDNSGGVFGPEGTGATHFVGYISILALFLLVGWWGSEGRRATAKQKTWMLTLGLIIAYDLIFMTDTKHALFLMPIAVAPLLFHPKVALKQRIRLIVLGVALGLATFAYVMSTGMIKSLAPAWNRMVYSPKGEAYQAVTVDFAYLVPYPVLGAGPGRFFSPQAAMVGAPLARRYVTPYQDDLRRWGLTHVNRTRTRSGSLLSTPTADSLTLMGEFGWLGTLVYFGFVGWVWWSLWQKAKHAPAESGATSVFLALSAGVLFLPMTMLFATCCTAQPVMFPWWILVGCLWDMPLRQDGQEEGEEGTVTGLPEPAEMAGENA
ncbi:MAG: hypothetical protein IK066_11790 [Kiritimatiellae bacterium]|nr:hypothetical protein [Kiritimatiellia bacterium]